MNIILKIVPIGELSFLKKLLSIILHFVYKNDE